MTSNNFIKKALDLVQLEYDCTVDARIVWFNYTLGNMKALIMVDGTSDYYEVIYHLSNKEIYVVKYIKEKSEVYEIDI